MADSKDAFSNVQNVPPVPPIGEINPTDARQYAEGSLGNPSYQATARAAFKVVVGPEGASGVDFTDIQKSIDYVDTLGGGVVFLSAGTYFPKDFLTLRSNVSLVGESLHATIIDFTKATLAANEAGIFAGGTLVTKVGTSISGTLGLTTITGVSTKFSTDGVVENDTFYINGHPYRIASVESDTSLTLKEIWRGPNFTDTAYSILRPVVGIGVNNLTLISDRGGSNNSALLFTYCEQVSITRVRVRKFSGDGIVIEDSFNFNIENTEAHSCKTGIEVHNQDSDSRVNNGAIINCLSWGNSNRGINVQGNALVRIIGCTANGNNLGIKVAADEINVSGCHSEFNALDGIRVASFTKCQIIGNNASSNGAAGIALVSNGGTVQNCTISGNATNINAGFGIYVDGTTSAITGNSMLLSASTTGIHIADDGDDCSITGNVIDGASNASTIGINIATGASRNKTSGNVFLGLTTKVSDSGTGTIRASHFVPITPVTVVNVNPSGTGWTAYDATGDTSATTYSVLLSVFVRVATEGREGHVRKTGSGLVQGALTRASLATVDVSGAFFSQQEYTVDVNTSQSFDYSVSNSDVSSLVLVIRGYYEYTD